MVTSITRTRILDAIASNDLAELQSLSLLPCGLAYAREEAWTYLLRVTNDTKRTTDREAAPERPTSDTVDTSPADDALSSTLEPHADERQVKLDTDRSFVIYPVESETMKERRKEQLRSIIVSVLRRRPSLGYFQGYHDIVSVLLLTFDPEITASGDHVELIRICVEKLSLHRLRDYMGIGLNPLIGSLRVLRRLIRLEDSEFAEVLEKTSPLPYFALSNILTLFSHDIPTLPLIQHVFDYLLSRPPSAVIYLAAAITLSRREDVSKLQKEGDDGMMHAILTQLPNITDDAPSEDSSGDAEIEETPEAAQPKDESKAWESFVPAPVFSETDASSTRLVEDISSRADSDDDGERTMVEENDPAPAPHSVSTPSMFSLDHRTMVSDRSPQTVSDPANEKLGAQLAAEGSVPLTNLLTMADELYTKFPPTSPSSSVVITPDSEKASSTRSLNINEIMGPNSVFFTWSEDCELNPTDDAAEQIVVGGLEDVVFPYDGTSDREDSDDEAEWEKPKAQDDHSEKTKKDALYRQQLIKGGVGVGVAVLVGVAAVMLYTVDRSTNSSGSGGKSFQEWHKSARWAGAILIGIGERVVGAL